MTKTNTQQQKVSKPTCSSHCGAGFHQINDSISEAQRAGNLDRARDELCRDTNAMGAEELLGDVRKGGTNGLAVELVDGSVLACNEKAIQNALTLKPINHTSKEKTHAKTRQEKQATVIPHLWVPRYRDGNHRSPTQVQRSGPLGTPQSCPVR